MKMDLLVMVRMKQIVRELYTTRLIFIIQILTSVYLIPVTPMQYAITALVTLLALVTVVILEMDFSAMVSL